MVGDVQARGQELVAGAGWGIVVATMALAVQAQFDSDAANVWRFTVVVVSVLACTAVAKLRGPRQR